jgi:antitoxin HigA-1
MMLTTLTTIKGEPMKQKMPPAHPGEALKGLYLDPLGISVTEAAEKLGVTRKTLSQLINGRSGLSAEMAVRLSKGLGTTPELWLNMQQAYDLWGAEKKMQKIRIKPIRKAAGALRRAS